MTESFMRQMWSEEPGMLEVRTRPFFDVGADDGLGESELIRALPRRLLADVHEPDDIQLVDFGGHPEPGGAHAAAADQDRPERVRHTAPSIPVAGQTGRWMGG